MSLVSVGIQMCMKFQWLSIMMIRYAIRDTEWQMEGISNRKIKS